MNLSFFYFPEESWFWTEGERGLKQVDKRISFQSLCLDLQLKFDQYLSLICVCIYSSRFSETFKPLGPLNLGTIIILYGANIPKSFSTSVFKKRNEVSQWSELYYCVSCQKQIIGGQWSRNHWGGDGGSFSPGGSKDAPSCHFYLILWRCTFMSPMHAY